MLCRGEFPAVLAWLETLPMARSAPMATLPVIKPGCYICVAGSSGGRGVFPSAHTAEHADIPSTHQATLLAFQAFLAINRGNPEKPWHSLGKPLDELRESGSFFTPVHSACWAMRNASPAIGKRPSKRSVKPCGSVRSSAIT